MSLNEIKCNNYWANTLLDIDGYNTVYKCRNNNGGGVAILIRDGIEFSENQIADKFNEEIVGINCKLNKINISFFSYYAAPNKDLNQELVSYINKHFHNFLIMGDLNAKSEALNNKSTNKNGSILEQTLLNNHCLILNDNNKPTFHIIKKDTENYGERLDLFIGSTSVSNITTEYKVLETYFDSSQPLMYHSVIEIQLNTNKTNNTISFNKGKTRYLYKKANWEQFKSELCKTTFDDKTSMSEMAQILHTSIDKAAKIAIPQATNNQIKRQALPKPILNLIKHRNKLRRDYLKKKSEENKIRLYKQIELVKNEITEFKSNNWQEFVNRLGPSVTSSKTYWQRINRIKEKKKPKTIPDIIHNDKCLSTDEEKARAFGDKLKTTFNEDPEQEKDFNKKHKQYVDNLTNIRGLNIRRTQQNNKKTKQQNKHRRP